jgi:hypothetical protein
MQQRQIGESLRIPGKHYVAQDDESFSPLFGHCCKRRIVLIRVPHFQYLQLDALRPDRLEDSHVLRVFWPGGIRQDRDPGESRYGIAEQVERFRG